MAHEITVPRSAGRWKKAPSAAGSRRTATGVREGDELFILESDKASEAVAALDAGILRIGRRRAAAGRHREGRAALGYLVAPGEATPLGAVAAAVAAAGERQATSPVGPAGRRPPGPASRSARAPGASRANSASIARSSTAAAARGASWSATSARRGPYDGGRSRVPLSPDPPAHRGADGGQRPHHRPGDADDEGRRDAASGNSASGARRKGGPLPRLHRVDPVRHREGAPAAPAPQRPLAGRRASSVCRHPRRRRRRYRRPGWSCR